jgi:hypothetical protein
MLHRAAGPDSFNRVPSILGQNTFQMRPEPSVRSVFVDAVD